VVCNAFIIAALNRDGYPYKLSIQLFKGTAAAGAMAFLLVYFAMEPWTASTNTHLLTLVSGVLIAFVYLACLYFFKAIRADEVHFVKSILTKKEI
jgi:hypothetical protein